MKSFIFLWFKQCQFLNLVKAMQTLLECSLDLLEVGSEKILESGTFVFQLKKLANDVTDLLEELWFYRQ